MSHRQTLQDKVAKLREEMGRLKKLEVPMLEAPDQQLSLTGPDARSMNSRGTGVVGYNVQSAVDAKHHLIVEHAVSNVGSDRRQLSRLAQAAKDVLAAERLEVVANRGEQGDPALLELGLYALRDQGAMHRRRYRRVSRWVHADVLERAQARLDRRPDLMTIRRSTVEHPFGTIKSWMGSTHFLTRTIPKVSTEMSLQVLAYNMKRAISRVGVRKMGVLEILCQSNILKKRGLTHEREIRF